MVGLALVVFVFNLVNSSLRHFRHLVSLHHDQQDYFKTPSHTYALLKKHLFYAPLFRKRHTNEMRLLRSWGVGILPLRNQALILTLIIAGNVWICTYNIPWTANWTILGATFRNRTGVAATINLIPLVLFAGRNNPLIPLLGVSFDEFNLYHRWFGRMVAIESSAHVVGWALKASVASAKSPGGMATIMKALGKPSPLILTGLVSFCAMIAIPIQASSLLRHAFYETFLHVHIALAIVAFAALWMHLDDLPAQMYVKILLAGWVIERVIRVVRLVYRNYSRKAKTTALVEALPGDAVRVTMTLARPWTFKPGQYLFLTVPSVGWWTSHPFTVAWSEEVDDGRSTSATGAAMAPYAGYPSADVEKSMDDVLAGPKKITISAIIRARDGFTGQLLKRALRTPNGRTSLTALAEGPYGLSPSMASYGTALLIAGGVGITHALPYVRSLLAASAAHTAATRRISLVWIIQSPEHLEWVRPWMTQLLAMEGRRSRLRIDIFVTRPRRKDEVRSPSETVRMFAGRPNVDAIVQRECREGVGAVGVAVCGPGGLGDEVRKSVRGASTDFEVDLIEESFSW